MCIACTFRNAAVNNICEICSTPKPTAEQEAALTQQEVAAAEPVGEWDCTVCTFANSHGGTVCQMCGTAKVSESAQPEVNNEASAAEEQTEQSVLNDEQIAAAMQAAEEEKHQ